MSRDLFVSAVDLDKLYSIYGSKDTILFRKICDCQSERITVYDDSTKTQKAADQPLLAQAVRNVIDGEVKVSAQNIYQYEFASALIAETIGEQMNSSAFIECSELLWNEINHLISQYRRSAGISKSVWPTTNELLKKGSGMPYLPKATVASQTGFLTTTEVRSAWLATEHLALDQADDLNNFDIKNEARRAVNQYRIFLKEGATKSLGLFFRC